VDYVVCAYYSVGMNTTTDSTTVFDQAVKRMPRCIFPGFDSMLTKTVEDLWWFARIALDDYELGEDEADIRTAAQARAVRGYLEWLAEHK
jgi:hypothetical protein